MHYWLSYNFLSFTIAYFWLVLKRKSTVFPMENIHRQDLSSGLWNSFFRKLSVVLLAESLIRSVLTEFFDSILWYWPTTMHAWLQSLLTMTWIAFLFFVCLKSFFKIFLQLPCRACMKQPKEGRGGWSFAWFFLYMVIPFLLNFYQASMIVFLISINPVPVFQAVILLPRHSVTGYEASDGEQDTYWFSIESYVSHKFSLTIMGSIISMMFLPPVQEVFCKRRDPSEVYSFSEMH